MIAALALTLALVAPHVAEMDLQENYLAEKSALLETTESNVERAKGYEKLALHGHCTRSGNVWIGAWCLENAAYEYWKADKLEDSARCATAALAGKPVKECAAKAHGILGAVAGRKGNWQEALEQYEAALTLDPDYSTAKSGAKDCRTALARKR